MKNITVIIVGASIAFLLLTRCVNTPTAVDDSGVHTPGNAVVVTIDNVDSLLDSKQFAIVEFYSELCSVCKSLTWVIDSLAARFGDSVLVGANSTNDADSPWKQFSITLVPTYVLFKNGQEVTRRTFTENKPEVFDTLRMLLSGLISGTVSPDTADTNIQIDTVTPPNYITLDTLTFDTTVYRTGRVAMVLFLYAEGAPCISADSVIKIIAPLYENKAIIAKVNAWEQMPLSKRYFINSVPRYLFFQDSVLVAHRNGILQGDTLRAILDRLLASVITPISLDATNFDSLVSVAGRITMVDFFSPYCTSCRSMDDTVVALAKRYNGQAMIGKVNVDEDDSLAYIHSIESIPTFIFYDSGTEYERITGPVEQDSLAAALERGLSGKKQ